MTARFPPRIVLGEIGKGHHIAFNVLNVGRFKLGAGCVGSARNCIESAIAYAKQRKAFGKVIADFGLIREKLANMAAGIFTGEAMAYRTVGMMDAAIAQLGEGHDDMAPVRKVIDEFAVECSILKVWGSEFIDFVVDETVQIYGGYGFVEEYPAERNYRDVRVNRIFEGTNEINRLLITGFLLKRAMSGQLPLMAAIKKLMDEMLSGTAEEGEEGPLAQERKLVAAAKKIGLFAAGIATQKYMQAIQDQQEIMGAIANMTIETYAMESAVLRAQKLAARNGEAGCAHAVAMARVYMLRCNGKNRKRGQDGHCRVRRRRHAAFAAGNSCAGCASTNHSTRWRCGRASRRESSKPGSTWSHNLASSNRSVRMVQYGNPQPQIRFRFHRDRVRLRGQCFRPSTGGEGVSGCRH